MMKRNRIKGFICVSLKNFIYGLERKVCHSKEEMENIKKIVKSTYDKSDKYENIEQNIPKLLESITNLKDECNLYHYEKNYYLDKLKELYVADIKNDEKLKHEVFTELGFEKKEEKHEAKYARKEV